MSKLFDVAFECLASYYWHSLLWCACMLWKEHCMLISQSGHAGEKLSISRFKNWFCLFLVNSNHATNHLFIENTVAVYYLRHPLSNIPMHVLVAPWKVSTEKITWLRCSTLLNLIYHSFVKIQFEARLICNLINFSGKTSEASGFWSRDLGSQQCYCWTSREWRSHDQWVSLCLWSYQGEISYFVTISCFQVVIAIVAVFIESVFLEAMCNYCDTCTMKFETHHPSWLFCVYRNDSYRLSVKLMLANLILGVKLHIHVD